MTKFVCDDITVLLGDCVRLLRTVPQDGTIITDPPFTMMNEQHLQQMLKTLPYNYSDVLVLSNPLSGYIYQGQFQIAPELSTVPSKYHRHARPAEEVKKLVALTKGIVIDPYCGSGSTLLAAHSLGRPSIGIEIDRQSFNLCCESLVASMGYGGCFS